VAVQIPQELGDKARDALETYRDATAGPDPRAEVLRQANG
jgi:molecular chaperone DnaJ